MKTFREYYEQRDLMEMWPFAGQQPQTPQQTVSAPVQPRPGQSAGRRGLPYNPNWMHRISQVDYEALPYHQKQALHAGKYGEVPDFNVQARGL